MLCVITGTDRMKAREVLKGALEKVAVQTGGEVIRITDTHTVDDLHAVLRGGGLFGGARTVVLDEVLNNEALCDIVLAQAEAMCAAPDTFFVFEESLTATTRKTLEKHACKSERFDVVSKEKKGGGFNFKLADAIRARNKKVAWIEYQRELLAGTAAEAIHGVFFWAAKQMLIQARSEADMRYGKKLVALLTKLPHEARRMGAELEYPLERFVLSIDVIK